MTKAREICPGALLTPCDLHGLLLKNRVVMSPLTRSRAGAERMPNPLMAEYYSQRASAGLIITEATVVSKQGIGWLNSPGIYSDEQAEAWKMVVDAVHARGTADLSPALALRTGFPQQLSRQRGASGGPFGRQAQRGLHPHAHGEAAV